MSLIWPCVPHKAPGPVSNLTLVPESDYIIATWNFPAGTVPTFKITLQLDGEVVQTHKQQESEKTFTGLKNAANYTVTVRITSGELESPAVSKSTYTSESLWPLCCIKVKTESQQVWLDASQ